MRPFAHFYGGKWQLARRYGPPQHQHVIEPFAGFAGYSCYWEPSKVTLLENDPIIVATWRYLQRATTAEIMAIPTDIEHLDELQVCPEAKYLVGWWFDTGLATPGRSRRLCSWARSDRYRHSFWGQRTRARIASQLEKIRHWTIIEGSWEDAPDISGHWFIDPPYAGRPGQTYACNEIDYPKLAEWCRQRRGYVQVCEAAGADWLPFQTFTIVDTHRPQKFSAEAVYEFSSSVHADPVRSPAHVRTRRPLETALTPKEREWA